MAETQKARPRREAEGFFEKYINNKKVIDVGCGRLGTMDGFDPIAKYEYEFSDYNGAISGTHDNNGSIVYYHDKDVCDASKLSDFFGWEKFDVVYASHVLEHLNNPLEAIADWFRLVKKGGIIIIAVPHRDLYEKKKLLPSRWNGDHKFFILPDSNEPPCTFSLRGMVMEALSTLIYKIVKLETIDTSTNSHVPDIHSDGEFSIEIIIQK